MISIEALFKISYGLYIVSSGNRSKGNGFISNTVFQVTAEPPKFSICCNKNNFTASLIREAGAFSVSVLHKETSPEIFGRFGYKSGRDIDKMEGMSVKYGETGVPIVLNDSIAFFECRVVDIFDAGTHLLFIGELLNAELIDDNLEPLTYLYYRQVKKGAAPKNAPTYIDKSRLDINRNGRSFKKFRCPACGYIYDEQKELRRFIDLPEDWVCPVCGSEKSDFIEF